MTRRCSLSMIAALGLILAGCATHPAQLSPEKAREIKRIAPVSIVGDSLKRMYVGLTVFGNEYETLDIRSWALDAGFEDQMAAAINRYQGREAVRANYDRSAFLHVNDATGALWRTVTDEPNWAAIVEPTQRLCKENALDAVLVAAHWNDLDFIGGSNQANSGLGIYVRGPGERVSVLFMMVKTALLDCKSGQPIAIRYLSDEHRDGNRSVRAGIPLKELPGSLSRKPIPEWTENEKTRIRDDLQKLPARAWRKTVKALLTTE